MSAAKKSRANRGAASVESVRARADALTSALASGVGCLPARGVHRAEVALVKAAQRTSIGGGFTVVALAGATGSGKSSLFNQLIGTEVARIGARRPTTATPTAAVWGNEPASALLDWLQVGKRHMVDERLSGTTSSGFVASSMPTNSRLSGAPPGLELDGLVLLDLPDFDSSEETHRLEVDRLLDLVDVFIWVTDPQKYADARLHEDYVARLSAHDAVTMVVLNQADRLTFEMLAACRKDLVRLLGADGVTDPEVIATSATDGSGVVDLRHRISQTVTSQNAAVRRLDSDLRSVATGLRSGVADSEPSLDDHSDASLVDALKRAAGIPVILDAVERDYRRASRARAGWPLTRWVKSQRPAQLKLLRLNQGRICPFGWDLGVRRPPGARSVVTAASDPGCSVGRGAGGPRAGGPGRSGTASAVDRRRHRCCNPATGRPCRRAGPSRPWHLASRAKSVVVDRFWDAAVGSCRCDCSWFGLAGRSGSARLAAAARRRPWHRAAVPTPSCCLPEACSSGSCSPWWPVPSAGSALDGAGPWSLVGCASRWLRWLAIVWSRRCKRCLTGTG